MPSTEPLGKDSIYPSKLLLDVFVSANCLGFYSGKNGRILILLIFAAGKTSTPESWKELEDASEVQNTALLNELELRRLALHKN